MRYVASSSPNRLVSMCPPAAVNASSPRCFARDDVAATCSSRRYRLMESGVTWYPSLSRFQTCSCRSWSVVLPKAFNAVSFSPPSLYAAMISGAMVVSRRRCSTVRVLIPKRVEIPSMLAPAATRAVNVTDWSSGSMATRHTFSARATSVSSAFSSSTRHGTS